MCSPGLLGSSGGGPRGATKRVSHEGVLEAHALLCQEGAGLWHVPGVEVVFAHVVGEDEDHVWLAHRLGEGTLWMAGTHTQANEHAHQREQRKVFISPSHHFTPSHFLRR
jgi:hypothetical protein